MDFCKTLKRSGVTLIIFRFLILLSMGLFASGCSDSPSDVAPTPPSDIEITAISITPLVSNILVDTAIKYQVNAVKTDFSVEDITDQVIWEHDNAAVVTDLGEGEFFGISQGHTTVTAIYSEFKTQASLSVIDADITDLIIFPQVLAQPVGTYAQLSAVAYLSNESVIDVTHSVLWTTSSSEVASVNVNGFVDFISAGNANISGEILTFKASSAITVTSAVLVDLIVDPVSVVTPVGVGVIYQATGVYADGSYNIITDNIIWQSSDSTKALINNQGIALPLEQGTVEISAQVGVITDVVDLTVTSATITKLNILPREITRTENTSGQFFLLAEFSDGSVADVAPLAVWSSDDSNVAMVVSSGEKAGFTQFIQSGSTQVHASYQGLTSSSNITVSAASLVNISLSPKDSTLPIQGFLTFDATGIYDNGTTETLTQDVNWISSNTGIATIDQQGNIYPHSAGITQISANKNGVISETSLTIVAQEIDRIDIVPGSITSPIGTIKALQALAYFKNGQVIDITNHGLWTSQDDTVAFVKSTSPSAGLLYARSAGKTVITFSFEGHASSIDVNVTSATLTDIVLTPSVQTIAKGLIQQYTATGFYSDGSQESLNDEVTWLSSDNQVASINQEGLAQSVEAGTSEISVSFSGVTQSAQLNVTQAQISKIQVFPPFIKTQVGHEGLLRAVALFSDKTVIDITSQSSWVSSDESIASVSNVEGNIGYARAIKEGNVSISARYLDASSRSLINVVNVSLISIVISPIDETTTVGGEVRYQAVGIFSDNSSSNITDDVIWKSNDAEVASIGLDGVALALSSGNTEIEALLGDVVSKTNLAVIESPIVSIIVGPNNINGPVGTQHQLNATALFADGSRLDITDQAAWQSSHSDIAFVSSVAPNHGLVDLLQSGTSTITASFQSKSGSVAVSVYETALTRIQIIPTNKTVPKGSLIQYSAVGIFNDGTIADISPYMTWGSSNKLVSVIDDNGLAYGQGIGQTSISAQTSDGSMSSSTSMAVNDAILTGVKIYPFDITRPVGVSGPLKLIASYSDGSLIDVTSQATWTSSNPSVAYVQPTGENAGFTQLLTAGESTISATYNSISSNIKINVTSAELVSITITPQVSTIANGLDLQYVATGHYSDSTSQVLTDNVSWSSSNESIASIDSMGVASANALGVATITAIFDSISSVASLTVTNAELINIEVTPVDFTGPAGTSKQLNATAYYSNGSSFDVTNNATWTSSDDEVARVNITGESIGEVSLVTNGSATITANFFNKISSSTVVVTQAVLTSIQVTPFTESVTLGYGVQYNAIGIYSNGNSVPLTEGVSWDTNDNNIASINAQGLAEGEGVGTVIITATVNNLSAEAHLLVSNAVLTSVKILPGDFKRPAGVNGRLISIGYFSDGTSRNVSSEVTWSTSNNNIVNVVPSGLYAGYVLLRDPGSADISISVDGMALTDTITITVLLAELESLEISPINKTLPSGLTVQYEAVGYFSDGSSQTMTNLVNWFSSDEDVAIISEKGLAKAISNNGLNSASTTISATYLGNHYTETHLFVSNAVITSIQITPNEGSNPAGLYKQFTATAHFSDNSSEDVTRNATWTSADENIVDVVNSGLQAGLGYMAGVGTTIISAKIGDLINDSISINVTAAELESIEVNPPVKNIALGLNQQYYAQGHYSDQSTHDITHLVSWNTSNSAVAKIDLTGFVTTQGVGNANISAQYPSFTNTIVVGNATLHVNTKEVIRLDIYPLGISAPVGTTKSLKAFAIYTDKSISEITTNATWISSNNDVATVVAQGDNAGFLNLHSSGDSIIKAGYEGVEVEINVEATQAVLSDIIIDPIDASMVTETTLNYKATGIYSDGSDRDITTDVTWKSSNTVVATINSNTGVAFGVVPGTSNITATLDDVEKVEILTVIAAVLEVIEVSPVNHTLVIGQTEQYQATGIYDNAKVVDLTKQVTWSTGDNSVATISNSNAEETEGLLYAIGIGDTIVKASLDLIEGSTSITVSAPTIDHIDIIPENTNLPVGTISHWLAEATYSNGETFDITNESTWFSDDPDIAASLSGVITAIKAGNTNINISFDGLEASETLAVVSANLVSVEVTPSFKLLTKDGTQQLTAIAYYSNGSNLIITDDVLWSSDNELVASISNDDKGLVTASSIEGVANISFEYESVFYEDQSIIDVGGVTLDSIEIFPKEVELTLGSAKRFQAIGVFSDGHAVEITSQVIWSSTDQDNFPIYNDDELFGVGFAEGTDPGVTIQAESSDGLIASDLATVVVGDGCEGHKNDLILSITPVDSTLSVGATVQIELTATSPDGCEEQITFDKGHFHIEKEDKDILGIGHETGLATGLSPGVATVEGESQGEKVTTTVTVIDEEIVLVEILPTGPLTTTVGGTVDATCVMETIKDGQILPETDITDIALWQSLDESIIEIDVNMGSVQKIKGIALGTNYVSCEYAGKTGYITVVVQ